MNTLYLASESQARQKLISDMGILFKIIEHTAPETVHSHLSFDQLVATIAREKMDNIVLPEHAQEKYMYVLTADTMGQDQHGVVHGKPKSKDDAINKIRALSGTGRVVTAFCLDRKKYSGNNWHIDKRIEQVVETTYVFEVPNDWIETYLERIPNYMNISGAITIESFGAQFLKSINGSYSAVLGLPIFELRQALYQLGFYESV